MPSPSTTPATALEDVSPQSMRLSTGPIIVATDGMADSDAAITAAHLLGTRTGAPVQVVSALEPIVIPSFGSDFAPIAADVYAPRRAAQREAIHEQLRRLLSPSTECPVTLIDGDPASVLAKAAHDRQARLLILGRGRHRLMDRLLLGETVLRVLQLADVPVLAAEPGMAALPRRVVIAIDFSPYSVYAARVALSIVDPGAALSFVHVAPRTEQLAPGLERLAEPSESLQTAFERVRREIGAEQMSVEYVTLRGTPGDALVDFVTSRNADLVVSGTHGYGFFNRLILGSVATHLVRGAPCSVLAVPGSAAARAATREHVGRGRTRSAPSTQWSKTLAEFSRRNASRQCTIEIDDTALGAQVQGHALPFVGGAFDHHGNEVQLMFGASGLSGRYLSHVVPGVSGIELLADADGRDRALRVATESGSTLVTFTD